MGSGAYQMRGKTSLAEIVCRDCELVNKPVRTEMAGLLTNHPLRPYF
jgi:hypothetical protein